MLELATSKAAPPVPNEASPARPRTAVLARLTSTLPTLVISAALGGVLFLGHQTSWRLPKFSVLTGSGASTPDDWCAEHSVPESICVECKPDRLPRAKEFGWCKQHGVQECPLCHPEIAQLKTPPTITQPDLKRVQRGLDFAERTENNNKCKTHHRRLQFASQAAAEKAGVEVGPVIQAPVREFIATHGEITGDQTRVARLSSRLPGTVWQVNKQVGDRVQKGEIVALVDAAEVGRAKAEFLQALAQLDLKTRIYDGLRSVPASIPGRSIQEAETALAEARIRLQSAQQALVNLGLPIRADELKSLPEEKLAERVQFLGLPESFVQSLDRRSTTGNLLPIAAPVDGVVVVREVVVGEVVGTAKLLFILADNRQMWLNLEIRIEDGGRVARGQPVVFQADGTQQEVMGKVTWISTAVDEKTRTVKVRAELPNPDGKLRAGAFGKGRIVLREEQDAVVVSKDAIHWEGCCHVVFVRDKNYLDAGAPKVFHVRKVVPGARTEQDVEVVAGLLPGEVVATKGSGILRSELLKNNLGDG